MTTEFSQESLKKSFYPQTAYSLGLASRAAYFDSVAVSSIVERWNLSLAIPPFDENHTQGFIAIDDDVLVLAFRGTDQNFRDWLRNLRVVQTSHDLGRVHRGFDTGLDQVWASIVEPALRQHGKGRKVWITGHSLGGALTALAGARIHSQLPEINIAGLVTFGQPRLGKREFRNEMNLLFDGRFHRYVNHRDVVPRIPPGYRHVGNLIYFDGEGAIADAPSQVLEINGSDQMLSEMNEIEYEAFCEELDSTSVEGDALDPTVSAPGTELEGEFLSAGVIEGIRDHSMVTGYIPALQKNLGS